MTKNSNVKPVFTLWKNTSKKGGSYFTGKGIKGFYNTKKSNPKEPDLKIFKTDEKGSVLKDTEVSMWCNISKDGSKKYLSGKYEDVQKLIGFINEKATAENKQPYIRIFFANDLEKKQEKKEAAVPTLQTANDDLPF